MICVSEEPTVAVVDPKLRAAQEEVLTELGEQQKIVSEYSSQLDAERKQLRELFTRARSLKISTYNIAKAVGISQPRVTQIFNSIDGVKRPRKKKSETGDDQG